MSTDKEFVLQTMRDTGLSQAQRIQAEAPDMTGTELSAEAQYILCGPVHKPLRGGGLLHRRGACLPVHHEEQRVGPL